MSTHFSVRTALRTKLLTLTGMPILGTVRQLHMEGFKFTPTIEQEWLRETLLIGTSLMSSLGPLADIRHTGLYQITVFSPPGVGTKDADTLAGAVMDLFPPGLTLSSGGLTVTIRDVYRLPILQDSEWLMSPVTVSWFAHTQNMI